MDMPRRRPPLRWTVALAKRRFSELLRAARHGPQPVYDRDQLVAVVVGAEDFRELTAARQETAHRSLGEAFADLRAICAQEGYVLALPERATRGNAFAADADEHPG